MPKFSIIIPVYNVALWLEDCINSILNQTYPNWEAICVDDGSTDSSLSILNKYADIDSRIKVFHQENKGVSSARNVALDNASGDWISSVDSDDVLSPHYFESALQAINSHPNIDVVRFFKKSFRDGDKCVLEDSEIVFQYYDFNVLFPRVILSGNHTDFFFRRETMMGVRYNARLKYSEDFLYACDCLDKCKSGCATRQTLYGYRKRSNSATTVSMTLSHAKDDMEWIVAFFGFLKRRGRAIEKGYLAFYWRFSLSLLVNRFCTLDKKDRKEYLRCLLSMRSLILSAPCTLSIHALILRLFFLLNRQQLFFALCVFPVKVKGCLGR